MSGRSLIVEADGGSRGNPGVAGYGALVRDAGSGALLAERAEPLGKESNNVAEYRGLIAGLTAAAQIDPSADVAVRMDSKLVIEQMSGRWKIKHPAMRELASQATDLVRSRKQAGGSVSWQWIPRAQNKHADKLSNDGMDGRTVHRDLWRDEAPADAEQGGAQADGHPEPDVGQPARIVLLRHGATDFTAARRLDGRGGADPELSSEGRAQAAAASREVARTVTGRAVVITSSLRRAKQTGDAVAGALGVTAREDADWDEQGIGDWDGLSIGQIDRRDHEGLLRMRSDPDFARPGGESRRTLESRVQAAFRRAVDAAGPGGTAVVVTHHTPIMAVLGGLLGVDMERAWMLQADPGSLSEVRMWRDRHASISLLNQTAHLQG